MSDPISGAKERWTPHPRPAWVKRFNDEGANMNTTGVVPLDEASLLASACQATGLNDFGVDDWRDCFKVLIKSFDEEAELNLLGRLRTRSELLQLLEARLQIEDVFKRHPEIDNEEICQPIIILGQGRGGTSFLLNVLASNPENGTLKTWEAIFPCPPPETETYHSDPRIERAHILIDQWNRVTPELKSMHEFGGLVPQDDCHILGLSFMSALWFNSLGQVPSYVAYLNSVDLEPSFHYEKRVLKLLQWKNPRKRWVLKDPTHIDHVDKILKVLPDACFIMPHRDPITSQASAVDLLGTLQWGRSERPFKDDSFDYIANPKFAAERLNALIDKLENGVVPERQIYNVQYDDLLNRTIETIAAAYGHLGLQLSELGVAAMRQYLRKNPRDNRPKHQYDVGDTTEIARNREFFKRYQSYFSVPDEDL